MALKRKRASQRQLTVGDRDFSYSVRRVQLAGDSLQLTATALDTEAQVLEKYGQAAADNIATLRQSSSDVLFGVDGTALTDSLTTCAGGPPTPFDLVTFNFPHSGVVGPAALESNRRLMGRFFEECHAVLATDGVVEVALKTTARYNAWRLIELAERARLYPQQVRRFDASTYTHRKTKHDGHTDKVRNDRAAVWSFVATKVAGFELPSWLQAEMSEEQHLCEQCDMVFTTDKDLNKHNGGRQHTRRTKAIKKRDRLEQQKAARAERKSQKQQAVPNVASYGPFASVREDGSVFCKACKVFSNSNASWEMHAASVKHAQNT
eukprot:TRINITY_DN8686_c0_g1_i4.p1 TRINITY_DN8686_c0_g1~~TRINITY_DN8686_c0_g1_i4.p1  ORF type:complete len:321 (+),score=70.82 TRINITY_DN8686_c0_g1_i4:9-971(+)